MFHVVLVEPEIPPNTGNVIRLCANTGAELHLIRPLGFPIDHARMRRAGLDYHEFARLQVHDNWEHWQEHCRPDASRIFAVETGGVQRHDQIRWQAGDWLVFGCETGGLPPALRDTFPQAQRVRLPMRPDQRSLNLGNAVAVTVFEAWRQHGYAGSA